MAKWTEENERQDWPPFATLLALETELLGKATEPDDKWIDRVAAVKTIRDFLIQAADEPVANEQPQLQRMK